MNRPPVNDGRLVMTEVNDLKIYFYHSFLKNNVRELIFKYVYNNNFKVNYNNGLHFKYSIIIQINDGHLKEFQDE